MPEIKRLNSKQKTKPPISIFLRLAPKHRLDRRPEIGINQVTGLDIEADLTLAYFNIEADLLILKPISMILKPI